MVCRNEEQYTAINWDDTTIYGLVAEPTEKQKNLLSAVNKLPIIYRQVSILYALEILQRQEIALKMEISLAATRFLIHRSGLLLQEYLENEEKQDFFLRNVGSKEFFPNWPYVGYSKLAELRGILVFLD